MTSRFFEHLMLSRVVPAKESIMTDKDHQGIVRDNRGEDQPADKERAQNVTSVEEKARNEKKEQKPESCPDRPNR
jgi:hypothetical protein